MQKEIQIRVPVDQCSTEELHRIASATLHLPATEITGIRIIKKSLDARKRTLFFNLKIRVFIQEAVAINFPTYAYPPLPSNAPEVHIIGAGPAGLFAALKCIELGAKPIVIERGKNVRDRRRDLAALNKNHIVNPESNYCFGEGGAGTYSDGKLYTRSKKRGDVDKILNTLVQFGAPQEITVDAHPHVGTNKLPQIISAMSKKIMDCGGEILFNTKLTDLQCSGNKLQKIQINHDTWIPVSRLILATGHSARDIYTLLYQKGITIESKSFALGVRVEHPRTFIDQVQYHGRTADDVLPPASYSLVQQINDDGVFSFCMCPGGIVAPCATSPGEVVTNGWSPSKRNNAWSNSGLVVTVDHRDFGSHPLDGMRYQQTIEQKAWELAGKTQKAPAQRVVDFLHRKTSSSLPKSSYLPGLSSVNLHDVLPKKVSTNLRKALPHFDKKMRGFIHPEAILIGVETRTSAPVRIPRNPETLCHTEIQGLYPCAEGAGYAGGIVSAAIDGEKCAQQAIANLPDTQ